ANGCNTSATVNVTGTPAATLSVSATTSVTCFGGNNGTASVSAGGTGPFTYAWSPSGGTSSAASNLTGGNYTVSVTDANSCMANTIFTLQQASVISASTNSTQANCGVSNGSATVIPAGGTPGYSYSWNTVPVQTTSTATGLAASPTPYDCTVTDTLGCTKV